MDLIYLGAGLALFATSFGLAAACEYLGKPR